MTLLKLLDKQEAALQAADIDRALKLLPDEELEEELGKVRRDANRDETRQRVRTQRQD